MDNSRALGIARVALTAQITIGPEKLDAILRDPDKALGNELAEIVDVWVRSRSIGYYPALEFLVTEGVIDPERFEALRTLAAMIRKRVRRDVQTSLWPIFSSVQIERAQSLAFQLPRLRPSQADARQELARHYFPNVVRLELLLSSLDKTSRLEEVAGITEKKVMRHLLDHFDAVSISATRRVESGSAEP